MTILSSLIFEAFLELTQSGLSPFRPNRFGYYIRRILGTKVPRRNDLESVIVHAGRDVYKINGQRPGSHDTYVDVDFI